jgi:hypothetical protein
MNRATLLFPLLSAALTLACDETPRVAEPQEATAEPAGPGLPVDHPPVELAPASLGPKRLTVDMLQASLPVVAGTGADGRPITWTITRAGREVEALSSEGLGRSLGRPDYVQITEEAALPTPLYAKFVDDMARDVCAKMVRADLATSGTRSLVRFASLEAPAERAAVEENLRYLMLRFLGQKVAPDDGAAVADLLTLFETAGGSADPQAGWTAVCVGLLTSPGFHLY